MTDTKQTEPVLMISEITDTQPENPVTVIVETPAAAITDTQPENPSTVIAETLPVQQDAKQEAKQHEIKVSPHDIMSFEQRIRNRTDPFTYLNTNYKFTRMNTTDEVALCSVLRALFGCSTFVDKLRQRNTEPVATELRNFITLLSFDKKNQTLDNTRIINLLENESKKIVLKEIFRYNPYGRIISTLGKIWSTSRFRKLFAINRIITGYCLLCKYSKQYSIADFSPYVITKKQLQDPAFDLEDSLYAERILQKYECEKCKMVNEYSVIITTNAPDVLTVVLPPHSTRYKFPDNITLPCEETRTHYYTIASFIYTIRKNNTVGVCIRTGYNDYLSYMNKSSRAFKTRPPEDIVKQYDLLCYVKVASIDNYSRVLE